MNAGVVQWLGLQTLNLTAWVRIPALALFYALTMQVCVARFESVSVPVFEIVEQEQSKYSLHVYVY